MCMYMYKMNQTLFESNIHFTHYVYSHWLKGMQLIDTGIECQAAFYVSYAEDLRLGFQKHAVY